MTPLEKIMGGNWREPKHALLSARPRRPQHEKKLVFFKRCATVSLPVSGGTCAHAARLSESPPPTRLPSEHATKSSAAGASALGSATTPGSEGTEVVTGGNDIDEEATERSH